MTALETYRGFNEDAVTSIRSRSATMQQHIRMWSWGISNSGKLDEQDALCTYILTIHTWPTYTAIILDVNYRGSVITSPVD